MKNMTIKKYNEVKNKILIVISFKNGIRTLTYSNVNYKKAIEHIIEEQSYGKTCIVLKNLPKDEVSYNFEDYKKYMEEI